MKGVVFLEFLQFAEENLGRAGAEAVIDESALASGGAYAPEGCYPFEELQRLVSNFCRRADRSAEETLEAFGAATGASFAERYEHHFIEAEDLFELLSRLDDRIHVEVRALYPKAELPSFAVASRDARRIVLDYRSTRRIPHFAKGVIESAAAYYRERVAISIEALVDDGFRARITVTRL